MEAKRVKHKNIKYHLAIDIDASFRLHLLGHLLGDAARSLLKCMQEILCFSRENEKSIQILIGF
jgi:hypothetical protein